ncbi:hypothetical protein PIB30_067705, partial [Stylosanthes scabra]|nr:hypothetical protein [Stylosanthes scabra]
MILAVLIFVVLGSYVLVASRVPWLVGKTSYGLGTIGSDGIARGALRAASLGEALVGDGTVRRAVAHLVWGPILLSFGSRAVGRAEARRRTPINENWAESTRPTVSSHGGTERAHGPCDGTCRGVRRRDGDREQLEWDFGTARSRDGVVWEHALDIGSQMWNLRLVRSRGQDVRPHG